MQSLSKRLWRRIKILTSPKEFYIYPRKIYAHHCLSFSQEGEVQILNKIFRSHKTGFYVDVGAYHPQRFSNTYSFYLKGWRGINIDAMPGSMKLFNELRPGDINVEVAIANEVKNLTYCIFDEPTLNSLSEQLVNHQIEALDCRVLETRVIRTQKLLDVLDKYLETGQPIHLLSVDVEGLDHQVLLSNDWAKYRPGIVLVEEWGAPLSAFKFPTAVFSLLNSNGYELLAKTFNTSFYRLRSA